MDTKRFEFAIQFLLCIFKNTILNTIAPGAPGWMDSFKVMYQNHPWKDDHWSFTCKKFQKDCKRKLAHQVQCSPTLPFHHDQDLREVISLPKILTTIPSCFSSVMASTSSSRRRSASSNGTTTEVSRSLAKPSAALPRTPDVRTYLSWDLNTRASTIF